MKNLTQWTLVGLVLLSTACMLDDSEFLDEEIDTSSQEIIGGTAVTRPEIGRFFSPVGSCTATLIAPRLVITAAHCLNVDDYQDVSVAPGDQVLFRRNGINNLYPVARFYSFGSHFTEKIWNGQSSDLAIIELAQNVPASVATPVPIAETRPSSGNDWSTRFGYGCTDRATLGGTGVLRYFSFLGANSNVLCNGDSGGPTMRGWGPNAALIWGINSGYAWDLFRGGWFDVESDATYHKKQIEGVMHAWRGVYEAGVDRSGGDYRSFATTRRRACRNTCESESQCRSWTLYRGTCYLKNRIPNWTPLTGATSGLSRTRTTSSAPEQNTDRPGSDYKSFSFTGSDQQCARACAEDWLCQSYAISGSSNKACYLKDAQPNSRNRTGIRSRAKRGLNFNVDRPGSDYKSFSVGTPSPEYCQAECARDSVCRSWAYRGPNNNSAARCWLKNATPGTTIRTGIVSGLKGREYY